MATSGESATQWLADQGENTPLERLEQIRNNLAAKLEPLDEDAAEYSDLLDALDVMDSYIAQRALGKSPAAPAPSTEHSPELDTRPLVNQSLQAAPISPDARRSKFAELLKTGRLPPEFD